MPEERRFREQAATGHTAEGTFEKLIGEKTGENEKKDCTGVYPGKKILEIRTKNRKLGAKRSGKKSEA